MSHRQTRTFGRGRLKPEQLPRWLRPKLTDDQVIGLGVAHIQNLDAIAKGEADEETVWQWVGGTLTWLRVAQLIATGEPEMEEQVRLATAVIERYHRTKRIAFTGPEYQLAKNGCDVMDALASIAPQHIASQAADWSEALTNSWSESGCKPEALKEHAP